MKDLVCLGSPPGQEPAYFQALFFSEPDPCTQLCQQLCLRCLLNCLEQDTKLPLFYAIANVLTRSQQVQPWGAPQKQTEKIVRNL